MTSHCLRSASARIGALSKLLGVQRQTGSVHSRFVQGSHVLRLRSLIQPPTACKPLHSNLEFRTPRSQIQERYFSSKPDEKPAKPEDQEEAEEEGPNWKVIVGIGMFAASLGAFINIRHYERTRRQQEEAENQREASVGVGGQSITGQSVGRPDLGGDFMLINQDGKLTKNTDFKGQWMFLYFGFTYCPDICPNELMRMVEVLNALDEDATTANKLLPIFVTIDPERDGPQQLKEYLRDWHPRFVGLTGSPEQVKDVSSKYRVYYSKASMGDDPKDYLIDHSVMFYLVDPAGQFTEYYGQNLAPADITKKIASHMKAFNP